MPNFGKPYEEPKGALLPAGLHLVRIGGADSASSAQKGTPQININLVNSDGQITDFAVIDENTTFRFKQYVAATGVKQIKIEDVEPKQWEELFSSFDNLDTVSGVQGFCEYLTRERTRPFWITVVAGKWQGKDQLRVGAFRDEKPHWATDTEIKAYKPPESAREEVEESKPVADLPF